MFVAVPFFSIPFSLFYSQPEMLHFFNETLVTAGLNTQPGNPVLTCQVNLEKNFAFLEVRRLFVSCVVHVKMSVWRSGYVSVPGGG